MLEVSQKYFANPSSVYDIGMEAKALLEHQREIIGDVCGTSKSNIYFTSGASEGNSWALESLAQYCAAKGKNHIISTAIEHHSILNKLKDLEKKGFSVTYIKPPFTIEKFRQAITKETGFMSVMSVNNETGEILPTYAIGDLCKKNGILFHTDATQYVPHFEPHLENVDMMTCSAHKFNGPRGVGFLYSKTPDRLYPLIFGGKQESHLRGGTENLPAICGMALALQKRQWDIYMNDELSQIKDYIRQELSQIPDLYFTYKEKNTVPILNFYVKDLDAEVLMSLLNQKEIYVSSTSACASGEHQPSHVLKAMGFDDQVASNAIRLSFDYYIGMDEINYALCEIKKDIKFLKG